ncbi:MAG: hypothetical protein RLZ51_2386 [Pseudomonadota bacterium]|jgi:hypothetical protein
MSRREDGHPVAPTTEALNNSAVMQQAAEILTAYGASGNLLGMGPWATKRQLLTAIQRSADWIERHAAQGRIGHKVELDQVNRRARSLYLVADVVRILKEARYER